MCTAISFLTAIFGGREATPGHTSALCRLDAVKRMVKIIWENANLKKRKKKPRLTFNPGLALIDFWRERSNDWKYFYFLCCPRETDSFPRPTKDGRCLHSGWQFGHQTECCLQEFVVGLLSTGNRDWTLLQGLHSLEKFLNSPFAHLS